MKDEIKNALEELYGFLNGHHDLLRCCSLDDQEFYVYTLMRQAEKALGWSEIPNDASTAFNQKEADQSAAYYEEAWLAGYRAGQLGEAEEYEAMHAQLDKKQLLNMEAPSYFDESLWDTEI